MVFIVTVAGTHFETMVFLLKTLTYHLIYDLRSRGVPAEVLLVGANEYGVKITVTLRPNNTAIGL